MKKHTSKKITILLLGVSLMMSFSSHIQAEETATENGTIIDVDETGNISYITPEENDISDDLKKQYDRTDKFEVVSTIGNYKQVIGTYDSYEEAKKAEKSKKRSRSIGDVSIQGNGLLRSIQYGTVDFNTKSSYQTTYYYQNADKTGLRGYINGTSMADGAYLETSADGMMVKFRMSGVTAWVSIYDVIIRDFNYARNSYYKVYNPDDLLCHYVAYQADGNQTASYSGGIVVGDTPAFIQKGVVYYSYDGIYFYTNYNAMIDDYRAGTSTRAVNPNNPYYNYFQYLPFRSKTNFTATQIDAMVAYESRFKPDSALRGTASLFINQQNIYGVNAAMMVSGAAIESGWGSSSYALNRNNLFGHAAYDSNPDLADSYPSIEAGIAAHAKAYLSDGYLNPKDSRYHGPHFGNKNGGINFSYASDPNLGEKYASIYYDIEYDNGRKNTDFGKYTLGVTTDTDLTVRKEPSTSSSRLYTTSSLSNQPVIILEKVTGTAVNGNTTWYKVQSDAVLTSDRTTVQGIGKYDFNRDYGYVSGEYIRVVYDEKNIAGGGSGNLPSDLQGDVNGDGYVSSKDYNAIKNHIMSTPLLTGDALKRADVNGDGYISSKDYNAVKSIIMS